MVERLLRLLLAFLVIAATGFSPGNPERVHTGAAPAIQGRSPASAMRGLRTTKVAVQARGPVTRQNGAGSSPDVTPHLPRRLSLVAPPSVPGALHELAQLVLPRRLNRPQYSGTPPPVRG